MTMSFMDYWTAIEEDFEQQTGTHRDNIPITEYDIRAEYLGYLEASKLTAGAYKNGEHTDS